MEYEYNFNEMTEKQLRQKYNWNINEIQNKTSEISSHKLLNNVCFYVDLFLGVLFGYIAIFGILNVSNFSAFLGLIFMILHGYCCAGFLAYSKHEQKELENRILELENENEIIQKQLGKVK